MVALLAEGVDRNKKTTLQELDIAKSPSSRRAWIEIVYGEIQFLVNNVALLAEGVDRNKCPCGCSRQMVGRPPRGGRG